MTLPPSAGNLMRMDNKPNVIRETNYRDLEKEISTPVEVELFS
jgi:hypothetical protein